MAFWMASHPTGSSFRRILLVIRSYPYTWWHTNGKILCIMALRRENAHRHYPKTFNIPILLYNTIIRHSIITEKIDYFGLTVSPMEKALRTQLS